MTGRYGFRTGIGWPVGDAGELPNLPAIPEWASYEGPIRAGAGRDDESRGAPTPGLRTSEFTLPMAFQANPQLNYATAAIGKWHLADTKNGWQHHPNRVGFQHYSGLIPGVTQSYFAWNKVIDGQFQPGVGYTPVDKVNDAIEWIGAQRDRPWFLWFAFNLPHTPLHLPPREAWQADHSDLDTNSISAENPAPYFKAMVEAMDLQIGRLLAALEPRVRENTFIIFLGDNGTIGRWISPPFRRDRAKSTIYEGGISVPLIVTGPGVARGSVTEALANSTDLFDTIMEMAGIDSERTVPDKVRTDSISFFPALFEPAAPSRRQWTYADVFLGGFEGIKDADYAIRNARYKLLRHDGVEELYDLEGDPYENRDLLKDELSEQERAELQSLRKIVRELRDSS